MQSTGECPGKFVIVVILEGGEILREGGLKRVVFWVMEVPLEKKGRRAVKDFFGGIFKV